MKKYISLIFAVVLCFVLHCAYADRIVNATDCKNVNDFFDAIEMGTTVNVNGFVYLGPFDYEMDNVKGYDIGIYIDIPGCISRNIFLMTSEEQSKDIQKGDYISISGKMFSRGNTGKNYYFNTQLEDGYVKKLEIPEPAILNLNEQISDSEQISDINDEEKLDMISKVANHRLGDIAKGENLKIVLTDEWTNTISSKAETTYYYYLSAGNIYVRFHTHTKDLFKGDYIDFEGTIYDYDEENKVLLCRDPEYHLHEDK